MMKQTFTPEQLFEKLNVAWNEARGDRAMPRRAEINPVKLGSALQQVSLVDVLAGNPVDFRYRLIGQQLIRAYGRNITGETHLSVFQKTSPKTFYDGFLRCTQAKEPQFMTTNFRNANNTPCRAQAGVWPLSDDQGTVTGLLIGCMYLMAEVG